jgi:hypothetical protein
MFKTILSSTQNRINEDLSCYRPRYQTSLRQESNRRTGEYAKDRLERARFKTTPLRFVLIARGNYSIASPDNRTKGG